MSCFIAIFALSRWSGTKPTMSPRSACKYCWRTFFTPVVIYTRLWSISREVCIHPLHQVFCSFYFSGCARKVHTLGFGVTSWYKINLWECPRVSLTWLGIFFPSFVLILPFVSCASLEQGNFVFGTIILAILAEGHRSHWPSVGMWCVYAGTN